MNNKINLELKYFCSDFVPVRKILKEIGAKKVGIFNQKDYFFNLPKTNSKIKPRLKLRIQKDKQTLIYYKRADFSSDKATPSEISLFAVKGNPPLPFLQKILGVKAIVFKKRELWKKGYTVFNLDEVNSIGKIFEIELTSHGNEKEEEKIFEAYRDDFLSLLQKIIKGSNLDLVLKK